MNFTAEMGELKVSGRTANTPRPGIYGNGTVCRMGYAGGFLSRLDRIPVEFCVVVANSAVECSRHTATRWGADGSRRGVKSPTPPCPHASHALAASAAMRAEMLAIIDGLELLPAVGGFTHSRFHARNNIRYA